MLQPAQKNKQEQDALFALLQGKELTPEQKIIIDAMGGVNIGQKKTSATGAKSSTPAPTNVKKELSWRSYIRSYSGPIVYSGQPFVYNGKTRIVPRGCIFLPEFGGEKAQLVIARNGEAVDINSIPMANSDQTPNKAKKGLSSATQMLNRAQKPSQEENKSFEIRKGLGQAVGGAYRGTKALGAGLLGTLATGSTLPLLAGALGGLGIAAGGIMKGIGNVTGITPAVGKAMGGLKSMVGMGGPTKAERASPLTNGQFINFQEKLFGYVDKEIDRDKRRLERMKRQSEYDEETADESRKGPRPGEPVRDGAPEKKPMSGLMKGLMVLGGIGALVAAITAIVAYKDELLKIWDEYGTALKAGAEIITGLAIAGGASKLLDMLPDGGGYRNKSSASPPPENGKPNAKPQPENGKPVRERHPAGTKNAAGKSIGGQFKSVEKGAVKEIIKKSILKRLGGIVRKSIPLIGFAFGAMDTVERLIKGDVVGAEIAAAGGAASFVPAVGTAIAVAAGVSNLIRDVYNDVYGVYPEKDDSGEVQERMAEIAKDAWDSLSLPKTKPVNNALEAYAAIIKENTGPGKDEKAGAEYIEAAKGFARKELKASGVSDEEINSILGSIKNEAMKPESNNEMLKMLQDSIAKDARSPDDTDDTSTSAPDDAAASPVVSHPTLGSSSPASPSLGESPSLGMPKRDNSALLPDSATTTIDANVSQAVDHAIITLPVKVLEGPPIIMPPAATNTPTPTQIQTRPNDSSINSAERNINLPTF